MTKKLFITLLCLGIGLPSLVFAKAPKDFQFTYFSSAGQLEKATVEKVIVKDGLITQHREAVLVGEDGEKKNFDKTFKITPEQLEDFYQIVQASGFMTWPKAAEAPHQSQVIEEIEITADGKTVKHNRWEQGQEEKFRSLYQQYDRWLIHVQSATF
jgi:hypothetical protein